MAIPRELVYAVAIDVVYPLEWGLPTHTEWSTDGRYTIFLAYFCTLEDARRVARSVYRFFSLPYIIREHCYVDAVHVARINDLRADPDLPRFQL